MSAICENKLTVPIIGLKGVMGHGKDSTADILEKLSQTANIKIQRDQFARKLRESVQILTNETVKAENTRTVSDKAKILPSKAFGDTLGDLVRQITAAMTHALDVTVIEQSDNNNTHSVYCDDVSYETIGYVSSTPKDGKLQHRVFITTHEIILKAAEILTGQTFITIKNNETTYAPLHTLIDEPKISVGRLLQLFGTDVGRDLFVQRVWVNALERKWKESGSHPIIITDARFLDEIEWILENGGIIIEVDASERLKSSTTSDGRSATHASETSLKSLDRSKIAITLDNNGSPAQLVVNVEKLWQQLAMLAM